MEFFTFAWVTDPQIWLSLVTLSALEIVLGIDNLVFIAILTGRLPAHQRALGRRVGLALALITRLMLLATLAWIVGLTQPVFEVAGKGFSWRDMILIAGGLFLLYKSTTEIRHKLEGPDTVQGQSEDGKLKKTLSNVIVQITVINIVFSFDSILTAVGMTNGLTGALVVMIIAVVISVLIMMLFAVPVGNFVNRHPTIQMLGLAFLILIGFMLIAEGAHLAHLSIAGSEVGAVPKGYLYFAISFSLFVEFLNMRLRKQHTPVQLHGAQNAEEPEKR